MVCKVKTRRRGLDGLIVEDLCNDKAGKEHGEHFLMKNKDRFYDDIYQIVAQIPPGCVATYGQLAAMCGKPRGARAVGWAMQNAPAAMNLPCHRVVNRSGALAPDFVFGGVERQRMMLESEGILFHANGTIVMEKHLWMGK